MGSLALHRAESGARLPGGQSGVLGYLRARSIVAETGPVRLLMVFRTRQKHGWRCTRGEVDGPLLPGVPIWMQA
jgi:hypothetical protein